MTSLSDKWAKHEAAMVDGELFSPLDGPQTISERREQYENILDSEPEIAENEGDGINEGDD